MKTFLPFLILLAASCQDQELAVKPSAPEPIKVESGEPEPQKSQDSRFKAQRLHQLKDLETRKMVVNGHTLTLWLMDNASKRQEGMMWLEKKDVKDTEGMLFVFSKASQQGFWMQNCPLGLDITYIDPKGKVLNTGVGKPWDETSVPSKGSAQYVLELKVGLAKKFGIKPGMVLKLPSGVKSKD
jgi:uncharacterized membrane protein (UPF0127 family)